MTHERSSPDIELVDRVALAINAAWNRAGDVPFPLYQQEAEALAAAAIEAVDTTRSSAATATERRHAAEAFEEADYAVLYRIVDDSGTTTSQEIWNASKDICAEAAKGLFGVAQPSSYRSDVEIALREIRRYCDENLGPSRSSLLSKIANIADAALAMTSTEDK